VRLGALLLVLVAALGVASAAGRSPDRARVLVFSKTTGFRHDSIPAGVAAIRSLGRRHGFRVDHTEDAGRFTNRGLARYDAVVFLSTTGDPLGRPEQKRALRRYVERGGGFFGIHGASDTAPGWRWFDRMLGARFRSHPPGTPAAVVRVPRRRTAATRGLPAVWRRTDEWYAFESDPRRVRVLLRLGATGRDHPIAWCRRERRGRSVYTAMGHTTESYAEPLFRAHLLGAIRMAAGRARFDCP
jgi:type 1 glutamine amidotransferase